MTPMQTPHAPLRSQGGSLARPGGTHMAPRMQRHRPALGRLAAYSGWNVGVTVEQQTQWQTQWQTLTE
jgi:hypothetical protein